MEERFYVLTNNFLIKHHIVHMEQKQDDLELINSCSENNGARNRED